MPPMCSPAWHSRPGHEKSGGPSSTAARNQCRDRALNRCWNETDVSGGLVCPWLVSYAVVVTTAMGGGTIKHALGTDSKDFRHSRGGSRVSCSKDIILRCISTCSIVLVILFSFRITFSWTQGPHFATTVVVRISSSLFSSIFFLVTLVVNGKGVVQFAGRDGVCPARRRAA